MTECAVKNTLMALNRFTTNFTEKDLQGAAGFLIDGRKCLIQFNLIPQEIDVALQCIRWLRSAVF
ncbi:uncharacterized protein LOC144123759 [Amblyomma americanum]